MRLGMDFGNGRDARAQHRHRIMRREQFSGELDIRQIAPDRRRALVAFDAMPAEAIGRALFRWLICQLVAP